MSDSPSPGWWRKFSAVPTSKPGSRERSTAQPALLLQASVYPSITSTEVFACDCGGLWFWESGSLVSILLVWRTLWVIYGQSLFFSLSLFELTFRYLSVWLWVLLRADFINHTLQTQGKKTQTECSTQFSSPRRNSFFLRLLRKKKKVVLTTNQN